MSAINVLALCGMRLIDRRARYATPTMLGPRRWSACLVRVAALFQDPKFPVTSGPPGSRDSVVTMSSGRDPTAASLEVSRLVFLINRRDVPANGWLNNMIISVDVSAAGETPALGEVTSKRSCLMPGCICCRATVVGKS